MTLLDSIRANIRAALDQRAKHQQDLSALVDTIEKEGRGDFTTDEQAKFTEVREAIRGIDEKVKGLQEREREISEMEEARAAADQLAATLPSTEDRGERQGDRPATNVKVKSEPMTYRRGGQHSYFRDLALAREPGGIRDQRAVDRITRHAQEMRVELSERDAYAEYRADMNRTDGTGGEFVPPLWLMDQYVPLARAGRVTAELCVGLPLPAGTDSINLPKVATGTGTAQQTDGVSVQKTDMTTTSVNAPVVTWAGQQVFAMQLLDQSPLNMDQIVFADLLASLAVTVDTYVLSATTYGILNTSGINSVTYTDASPTVPELYPKKADAIQQIHVNRLMPPQAFVMHPRRWAWELAALDSTNRPLIVPTAQGPQNAFAGFENVRSEGAVGQTQGLPIYVDPNIPTNLGAGTDEDRIIAARFDDLYLFEGALRTRVLYETDADTLEVRLQVWEYGAFLSSRYPKSVSVISGTGLITPTF